MKTDEKDELSCALYYPLGRRIRGGFLHNGVLQVSGCQDGQVRWQKGTSVGPLNHVLKPSDCMNKFILGWRQQTKQNCQNQCMTSVSIHSQAEATVKKAICFTWIINRICMLQPLIQSRTAVSLEPGASPGHHRIHLMPVGLPRLVNIVNDINTENASTSTF